MKDAIGILKMFTNSVYGVFGDEDTKWFKTFEEFKQYQFIKNRHKKVEKLINNLNKIKNL